MVQYQWPPICRVLEWPNICQTQQSMTKYANRHKWSCCDHENLHKKIKRSFFINNPSIENRCAFRYPLLLYQIYLPSSFKRCNKIIDKRNSIFFEIFIWTLKHLALSNHQNEHRLYWNTFLFICLGEKHIAVTMVLLKCSYKNRTNYPVDHSVLCNWGTD